jgi:hypothetical protein
MYYVDLFDNLQRRTCANATVPTNPFLNFFIIKHDDNTQTHKPTTATNTGRTGLAFPVRVLIFPLRPLCSEKGEEMKTRNKEKWERRQDMELQ